ncbi:hypothetical protein DL768_000577 [Monosporascus sp. mg162]|nr:hypothetical protein DL768_000577 [Monosporascus sp. mg162]
MYFGLLSAIVRKDIDRDTITRSDNRGRQTIDSIKVKALLKERQMRLFRLPPPFRADELSWANYILKGIWDIMNGPMLDYLLASGCHDQSDLWSEPFMAQLYAGAEQVLVFDPEIQHLPYDAVAGDKGALELCIKCCPWMSRSWPLQEGALGQNLYIRLKDRSILLNSTICYHVGIPSFRMLERYDQFPTIPEEAPIPDPATRLSKIWDSLANRSSTMTEDLPAILATMLDRSAEEILGLPGDRRMKALLKMEKTLPLAMFYQPNSLVAGRWNPNVPGSDPGQTSAHPHFGVLRVTEDGLILDTKSLDTSAIIVHGEPRSDHFTLEVKEPHEEGMRYSISQDLGQVKKGDDDTSKSLFLLSKLCATGTPKYHGACFSVNTLQSERLIIRFKTTVLWNYLDTKADPVGGTYTNCQWLENYEGEKFKEVLVDMGTYRF